MADIDRTYVLAYARRMTLRSVLVLVTLTSALACTGTPAPKAALFDCRVDAIQPVVGDVFDAAELVRDIYAGKASLGAALQSLKASEAETRALIDRLRACDGEATDAGAAAELPEGATQS